MFHDLFGRFRMAFAVFFSRSVLVLRFTPVRGKPWETKVEADQWNVRAQNFAQARALMDRLRDRARLHDEIDAMTDNSEAPFPSDRHALEQGA